MGRIHKEFFSDNSDHYNATETISAGPPILKDEVTAAISKMKTDKATGLDYVSSVELIEVIGDNGVDKVTSLLDEIYNTRHIPTYISKYIWSFHCQRNQRQRM
ncbi:hypothetical protein ElyMa_006110000 [Elysia marginata]|uniref:Uncharacterized protein n=1 Tax=Elysia marginata TaxID=1093978 RepID=A0AAV4GVC2_9GAST|nr:hypothetical protein ElyMa_006110000 [Elysia marginata]